MPTLARGEVPVMVALGRDSFPDSWINDRGWLESELCLRPEFVSLWMTKSEIALAEIDRMISVGVRFAVRCAYAGSTGSSAPFRKGLDGAQACLGGWH